MAGASRRGYGEDGIYFDHRDDAHHKTCSGRWRGVVSLGYTPSGKRIRKKVSGLTRTEVKDKLKALHSELDAGVRTAAGYTLDMAVVDWPAEGLPGRAAKTVEVYAAGVRSEEARALTWDHVDLDARTVSVWRSVRAHGDTKTVRSRWTLRIPQIAVEALQAQLRRQAGERATAGELWQEHGLVFTTTVGTPYESRNLRRDFRRVTAAAGLGARWVPKELRTSFVSMMSYQGVPVEEIARLAGHASSRTTEVVYRRELRPVITTGAEIMDQIFQPKQRQGASAEAAG
jgi:integrase